MEKIFISKICLLSGYIFFLSLIQSHGQPGALDVTFGDGGKVIMPVGEINDHSRVLELHLDGTFFTAGFIENINSQPFNRSMYISKHLPDGSVDTAFGTDGMIIDSLGSQGTILADIAIRDDGKIIALCHMGLGPFSQVLLLQFNPDGSYDEEFGINGKVMGPETYAPDLTIQENGKILLLNGRGDFGFYRFNSDGSVDTSFGENGVLLSEIEGNIAPSASAMKTQSDGKIVVVGLTYDPMVQFSRKAVIARFHPDGTLDNTFAEGGGAVTLIGDDPGHGWYFDVDIQADGKIVASGNAQAGDDDFSISQINMVARYNSDGSLDESFGENGIVITQLGEGTGFNYAVVIQPDGKIVTVGNASAPFPDFQSYFACMRYTSNGELDDDFGDNGIVLTNFSPSYSNRGYDVKIQSDGKIIAVGYTRDLDSYTDVLIIRYISDITMDQNELEENAGFVVYPNPSQGRVLIKADVPITSIEVYNVLGERMDLNLNLPFNNEWQLNFASQSSGVYFIKLTAGNKVHSKKVVIQ